MCFCRVGQQDVFVVLVGIGLLCVFPHHDVPVESCTGLFIQDALEKFVAVTVGFGMVDKDLVVDMLFAIH